MHPALNAVAFQVGWFACVLGAASGRPWLGLAATAVVVVLHLDRTERPGREALLLGLAALLGLAFDSALVTLGWLSYPNGMVIDGLAPYWIVAMWVLFAATLNSSLRWLHTRPGLAALFGLAGGPLSYLAGQRLGGVVILEPLPALIALGLGWTLAMSLLVPLARELDGRAALAPDRREAVAQ